MWIPVAETTNKKLISEMIPRKENETDELETKKTDGKDDDENGTEKKKKNEQENEKVSCCSRAILLRKNWIKQELKQGIGNKKFMVAGIELILG